MKQLQKFSILFVCAGMLLSACSILEEEPQKSVDAFNMVPEPWPECRHDLPPCYWQRNAVLSAKHAHKESGESVPATVLALDDSAQVLTLWGISEKDVPLTPGRPYSFEGDGYFGMIFGFQVLRVRDDEGLLYYAATSPSFSENQSLKLVPEGWAIAWMGRGSKAYDSACGTRSTPKVVQVSNENGRVWLQQGESSKLGDYIVEIRVSEEVEYTGHGATCYDYTAPELSLIVRRIQ